jgi:hypothetical protein
LSVSSRNGSVNQLDSTNIHGIMLGVSSLGESPSLCPGRSSCVGDAPVIWWAEVCIAMEEGARRDNKGMYFILMKEWEPSK